MTDFECPCGFKAKYKSKLDRHQSGKRPCDYIKEIIKQGNLGNGNIGEKNNFENLALEKKKNKKNKKLEENEIDILEEDEISIIGNKCMRELENDLVFMNLFLTSYNLSNKQDKKKLLENKAYSIYNNIINKYFPKKTNNNSNNSNQNENIVLQTTESIEVEPINEDTNLQIPLPTTTATNNNNNENIATAVINNINTNSNNNNNITNNTQITNNIQNLSLQANIAVVYPFGFENIYFLSDKEMIGILTHRDCLIKAMEKIYSNVENKNFMKRNVNRENMTIIDEKLKIQVLSDNIFKKKIIDNTFDALRRMFYHCKDKLKIEHQIMLWQNLRILEETIEDNIGIKREQNMCVEIREVIETISNLILADNETPGFRDKFSEIKNSIDNDEYKRLFNDKLNFIVAKIKEFNQDFKNKNVSGELIKNQIWTGNLDNDALLSLEHPINDIRGRLLEEIPRYMFIRDMEIRENDYLRDDGRNTIGNINELCKFRDNLAEDEYQKYKNKFHPEITELKTLERKLLTEPKQKVKNQVVAAKRAIMNNFNTLTVPQPTNAIIN